MASWNYVWLVLWINILTSARSQLLEDNFLLVVDGRAGQLYQLTLNGSRITSIPHTQQIHPVAIDYDPLNKLVFWTDVGRNSLSPKINSVKLDGSNQKTILTLTPSSSPEGIAVDPKLKLIFYTDNGPDTINVLLYDGTYEANIVRSAHNPRDIKLDTVNRHVYWADWGKGTIESCNYDGSDRLVMHQTNNAWINSLDLDLQMHKMFWTDARHDLVKTASILNPGNSSETVIDGNTVIQVGGVSPHYYGIAVDKDYIYLSDWTQSRIFRSFRNGTNYTAIGPNNFTMLNSLHVYESARHLEGGPSPCLENKGGCSAICLPVGNTNYTCACPEGQDLAEDKHKCVRDDTSSGPDMIWLEYDGTASSYIRGVKGEPRNFIRASSLQSWRIHSPLWHWKAADFNYKDKVLYMVDGFDKYIVQLTLNGTLTLQVIYYGLSSSVNGLAYDWLSGTMYWTDGFHNWIRACKTEYRTENVKTIIRTRLDSPHGIAVHPAKGLMFWTDWGQQDKIEVATLAGENRRILITAPQHVFSPTGITIDYTNNRLYWCNQHQLMSAKIDGSDVQTHYSSNTVNLVGITFHDNYIIATDKGVSGSRPYIIFLNIHSPNTVPKLGLDRWPSDVLMYHKDRQPQITTNKTMDCKSCSQLCVSEASYANHTRCLCRDGYRLDKDGRSCVIMDMASSPGFIYSLGDKICSVPIEDIHTKKTNAGKYCFFNSTNKYRFTALDFDYNDATIYFSEVQNDVKTIRKANLKNKQNNTVIVYGVGEVYGLAFDYTAGNIYWADNTRGQIWIARADGSYQKMLIPNRKNPRAIQINMKSKCLYWSEDSPNSGSQIMKSSLDGTAVVTFVGSNLGNVTGFTVDYISERLYWVDSGSKKAEFTSFDGNGRTTLTQLSANLNVYDIAILEDFIGVTDMNTASNKSGLHALELTTGSEQSKLLYEGYNKAFDVVAYGGQKHYLGNAAVSCGYNNGFCEQLCLQSDPERFVCACMDGMEQDGPDKKKCKPKKVIADKFLLIADDYRHTIHQVDPNDHSTFSSLKLPPLERPISVTYDPRDHRIYWSDFESGTIKRSFMNGTNVEIVKPNDKGSRIDGLVFEPSSELLYYTDTNKNVIGILSPTGLYHKILQSDDRKLANVRAMALDVTNGHMYYTVRGNGNAKIVRANLDTTESVTIISSNLSWPSGLAIDFEEKKIYWIDSKTEKIEFSNLDGTDRMVRLQLNSSADPFGLAVVKDTLYWTDWQHPGLFFAPKDGTGNLKVIHADAFPGLNDIHYINTTKQVIGTCASSSKLNGGCSHMCISTKPKLTCACPNASDGQAVVPGDFFDCKSPSCPTTIPNGQFEHGCKIAIGSSCNYTCKEGFGRSFQGPITCRIGLVWSLPLDTLCSDNTCPILYTPSNALIDNSYTKCYHDHAGPMSKCKFNCKSGFVQTGGDAVRTCLNNHTWSGADIQCEVGCLPLPQSPNTNVYPNKCKSTSSKVGDECHYKCMSGFIPKGGSRIRTCMKNNVWTGRDIVCSAVPIPTTPSTSTTTVVTVEPSAGDTGALKDTGVNVVPIAVGIVVAVIVLAAFIIGVVVYMYRHTEKGHARYRESTNFNGTHTDDLQPVVAHGDISLSYDAHNEKVHFDGSHSFNNNLYVAQNGHVKHDGSVAFNNPGYSTTKEVEAMNAQYSEIEYDQADEAINTNPMVEPNQIEVKVPEASDRTSFSNPLYENVERPAVNLEENLPSNSES